MLRWGLALRFADPHPVFGQGGGRPFRGRAQVDRALSSRKVLTGGHPLYRVASVGDRGKRLIHVAHDRTSHVTSPQIDISRSRLAREWTLSKAALLHLAWRRLHLIPKHLMSVLDSWLLGVPRQIYELRLIPILILGLSFICLRTMLVRIEHFDVA